MHPENRWIVKMNNNKIREVKLIFNPDEYKKGLKARSLYTQAELIKVLENEKTQ